MSPASPSTPARKWHLIDAQAQPLGRLASQVSQLLMGKHKPGLVPYRDDGDYVVVINAAKIRLTGNKPQQKTYQRYSGYPSGLKQIPFKRMLATHPERVIWQAVKGMLPKNKLQKNRLKRLKIFADQQHPYQDKLSN